MSYYSDQIALCDLTGPALSTQRERLLEHRLVSDLAEVMLRRGVEVDVMRAEFDGHGHDVVFQAAGVLRHVQLKAMILGGKRSHVSINVRLRSQPSGCVVWMTYDPATLKVVEYRWLGGAPGEPLSDIGSAITRHSKANMSLQKTQRVGHRDVAKSKFDRLTSLNELADRMFGPSRSAATSHVLAQLRERFGLELRGRVQDRLEIEGWDDSVELAHLIDGYRVIEQLCVPDFNDWLETHAGWPRASSPALDLGEAWTTLFLEHRRWRTAKALCFRDDINRLITGFGNREASGMGISNQSDQPFIGNLTAACLGSGRDQASLPPGPDQGRRCGQDLRRFFADRPQSEFDAVAADIDPFDERLDDVRPLNLRTLHQH